MTLNGMRSGPHVLPILRRALINASLELLWLQQNYRAHAFRMFIVVLVLCFSYLPVLMVFCVAGKSRGEFIIYTVRLTRAT